MSRKARSPCEPFLFYMCGHAITSECHETNARCSSASNLTANFLYLCLILRLSLRVISFMISLTTRCILHD